MCAGCFTGAEAMLINSAAGVAFLNGGLTRVRERLTGVGSLERRSAAYQANAEFLASLDLDPDRVLGPPPVAGRLPAAATQSASPTVLTLHVTPVASGA